MSRKIFGLILLLFAFTQLQAQPRGRAAERIQAIKVGYLSERLQLTPEQASNFWPVYQSYESELRQARRAFRDQARQPIQNDEEANQYLNDRMELSEDMLTINRNYKDRFLKVISAQQLATLYVAERDFKKLLLQQLRKRRRR